MEDFGNKNNNSSKKDVFNCLMNTKLGKPIRVLTVNGTHVGKFVEYDDRGNMSIKSCDNLILIQRSGIVSIEFLADNSEQGYF